MTSTGTCSGRVHLTSASSRMSVSFVNTLTEQATETINFPNQKPWVDRTIRDALTNALPHTTRLFCLGIWASTRHCVMLSDGSKSRQTSIQGENWVSFSAQWLSTHVAGTKDHLCLWKQILRGGESRSVAGRQVKHILYHGCFECNGGSATLPSSTSGSSRQRSENHVITVSVTNSTNEMPKQHTIIIITKRCNNLSSL